MGVYFNLQDLSDLCQVSVKSVKTRVGLSTTRLGFFFVPSTVPVDG